MYDVHIGRQPIYDRDREVAGYELLFRASAASTAATRNDDAATSDVIVAAFVEFGKEQLVGPHTAFVNITRSFAAGQLPLPFPPHGVVLELLEGVAVDGEVERGLRRLRRAGFQLALDDFTWEQDRRKLLPLVHYVKLDLADHPRSTLHDTVDRLHDCGLSVVAERLESPADYDACVAAGVDLFQGYHLVRPSVLSMRSLPADRLRLLSLMAQLCQRDVTMRDIESAVSSDPALSYRLLRAVRAVTSGLVRPVESVRDALVMLGLDRLRSWVILLALSSPGHQPESVMAAATTRARFCELLAPRWAGLSPSTAFLAGLLSSIDILVGLSLRTIVEELPLSYDVRAALVEHQGPLGQLLHIVDAYERGVEPRFPLPCSAAEVARAYLQALSWSRMVQANLLAA